MSNDNNDIVMNMGIGYVIFDAVCVAIFVIFFLMSAYSGVVYGVLMFFVGIIGSIFSFFSRKSRRIIVRDHNIIEKKMLKKQKRIDFAQVKYLTIEKGNNTDIICVHSKEGGVIKVPKYFQNVQKFEEIIAKQHWRWK